MALADIPRMTGVVAVENVGSDGKVPAVLTSNARPYDDVLLLDLRLPLSDALQRYVDERRTLQISLKRLLPNFP